MRRSRGAGEVVDIESLGDIAGVDPGLRQPRGGQRARRQLAGDPFDAEVRIARREQLEEFVGAAR